MLTIGTWTLISLTAVVGLYTLWKSLQRKRRPGEPPIVKGNFILGSAGDFSRHAVDFLLTAHKRYGDVFTIRLVNQHLTVIMDPHSYEAISREKNFDFDPIQKQVNRNVFSYYLIEPKKILTATTKSLKGDMLVEVLENFTNNLRISFGRVSQLNFSTDAAVSDDRWQRIGLRQFASKTIFDSIFNTIFGRNDEHAFNSGLAFENFELFHKYFNYLWLGFPICLFPKASKAQKEMLRMPESDELLARPDLSYYMRSALEFMLEREQTEMDIKGHNLVNLHVNYNTFRLAFWVLHDLLINGEAMDALCRELSEYTSTATSTEDNSLQIGIKDLENMKVLDSIVQESCRLSSGVFMIRYVTEDTQFTTDAQGTFLVRKGDRIALYPPALHKDPEVFDEPQVYKYNRFVDAKFYKAGKELKHPVMGFGTICPGKRYALLQLKWFIVTAITQFDFKLAPPSQRARYDTNYYGHEILPPVTDIQIEFRQRNSVSKLVLSRSG